MVIPTLAPNSTWFAPVNGTTRMSITEINIVDSYTPNGNETDSWDASAAKDGSVMCYVNGTVLTIAGNGSGKIYANADSSSMFYKSKTDMFSALTTINGISVLDTTNVTTLVQAFCRCIALSSLDLSTWDVSNVTDLSAIFQHCVSLKTVNCTGWNTKKVTSLSSMFLTTGDYGESQLKNVFGIGDWDVSGVTTMLGLFQMCENLESIDVSRWDTKSCTNMVNLFTKCRSLATLDISKWSTANITNMSNIFGNMYRLKKITLGDNFRFVGGETLPAPNPAYIPGADGKWYRKSDGYAFTPAELATAHTGRETYTAVPGSSYSDVARYLIHKIFSPVIAKALTDELFPLG